MINWDKLPTPAYANKLRESLNRIITADNYGFGEDNWNLTDLGKSPPDCAIRAYQVLIGDTVKSESRPELAIKGSDGYPMRFRLQVLSRQACCRSKDKKKICVTAEEYRFDEDKKILTRPDDKPEPGDVVEWKGALRHPAADPHLSVSHINEWQRQGIRPNHYVEFVVDKDGCIAVPYLQAHPMLKKMGHRNSPQFRKVPNREINAAKDEKREVRRITNWWFKEVPIEFKGRKERSDKGTTRTTNESTSPTVEPAAVEG